MNYTEVSNANPFSEVSSQTGNIISTEDALILENSLILLQNENHFRRINFWGKILGLKNDYYIVYGYIKDALYDRRYFYSLNRIKWLLVPQPIEKAKKLTELCTTRFVGDPSVVVNVILDDGKIKKLKEEDRLSAAISLINHDASIMPRGALFKRPDGVVVESMSFEGLTPLESLELWNYLHYRIPLRKWNTNLLIRNDYNYAMDFLDPVGDSELAENCWINIQSQNGAIVALKSLVWPGMIFYHYLKTPRYGFVYFGDGKRCLDVIFRL